MNCTLFRKQFERSEKFLQGYAVLEYQHNGQPHFHILVTNTIDPETLKRAVLMHASKFTVQVNDIKSKKIDLLKTEYRQGAPRIELEDKARKHIRHVPIFSEKGIDVTPVGQTPTDYEKLPGYLLKENGEFLPLSKDGLPYPEKGRGRPKADPIRTARTSHRTGNSIGDKSIYQQPKETTKMNIPEKNWQSFEAAISEKVDAILDREISELKMRTQDQRHQQRPEPDSELHHRIMQSNAKPKGIMSFSEFRQQQGG